MPHRTHSLRTFATLAAVALLISATATGASAKPQKLVTTKFHVDLNPESTKLQMVGAKGEITYGWVHLAGTAQSSSGPIGVDLLGNVQYTNGSGPNFGFVTLHFASLSDVGFRFQGTATKGSGDTTDFKAKMKVIGGNAALIGVKGGGSYTGTRAGVVGSPVQLDFVVKITDVSSG
jgi:hypothetical protein